MVGTWRSKVSLIMILGGNRNDKTSRTNRGIDMPIFYHVTLSRNVPSILKNGILPSINKEMSDKKAVYMFKDRDELEDTLMNWLDDKFPENAPLSILKINGTGLNIEHDPNVGFEVLTQNIIPPSKIIDVEKVD